MRFKNAFWTLISAACLATSAQAADVARGKVLYEARCNACHKTSVHQRESRRATSFAGIRIQVVRWSEEVGGAWSREDIDDVTYYLNDRYYFFSCPETVCDSAQAGITRTGALPFARAVER